MSRDDQPASLTRRRLLWLASLGVTAPVAGCGGGDGGDGTTTSPEPTDTDTTTTGTTTTDTTTTTEPTDTTTQTTTESGPALSEYLGRSPSSHVAPADGFADVSWVDEATAPMLTESERLEVLKVTNLDNSGEGSLRWALDQEGPRLVVFEVGGVIDLEETELEISNDRCWVAGHTAPAPGITVIRGEFAVGADECIVQHVRARAGDAGNESNWEPDALGTSDETKNVVVDHCTATWSVDEVLSVGYDTEATTVSNCMIAEALQDASHHKGPHCYGSLTGNGAKQVTYAGNLWAHNVARNPRLKAEVEAVVANNVMYHFDRGTNLDPSTIAAIYGNAYLRGGDDPHIEGGGKFGSRASVGDNYSGSDVRMTKNINPIGMKPFWPQTLEEIGGEAAIDAVLAAAGARPAQRDAHEERVVRDVRERTGGRIDSQTEVGGYPDFEPTERTLDVPEPGEGLGEWLYQHRKAVELPDAQPP